MRNYYSINAIKHIENIADNIIMRELELYSYDINIENYEEMLAGMTTAEWPEDLLQYRGKGADQIPDDVEAIVNELNYRDRIRALLKTEKAERDKSLKVYESLLNKIPENSRQSEIDKAVTRKNGKQQEIGK